MSCSFLQDFFLKISSEIPPPPSAIFSTTEPPLLIIKINQLLLVVLVISLSLSKVILSQNRPHQNGTKVFQSMHIELAQKDQ